MNNSILLGLFASLLTILIGMHANWLMAGTALLLLLLIYAIAILLFKRPRPKPLSLDVVPGDLTNIDKLSHRAMQYCNDIIDHYQDTRYTMRRYYVVAQILTATLSGLTPVLVLIGRNDALMEAMSAPLRFGVTWAVLILPGIAAVLATTATIFNFQEEWIQAKKTAEALEAVREEFVMGVPPHYGISARDPEEQLFQRKQALENFVLQVNALHLQQIDQWAQRAIAPQLSITSQPSIAIQPDPSVESVAPSSISIPPESEVEDASLATDVTLSLPHERSVHHAPTEHSRPELTLSLPQDATAQEPTDDEDGPFIM